MKRPLPIVVSDKFRSNMQILKTLFDQIANKSNGPSPSPIANKSNDVCIWRQSSKPRDCCSVQGFMENVMSPPPTGDTCSPVPGGFVQHHFYPPLPGALYTVGHVSIWRAFPMVMFALRPSFLKLMILHFCHFWVFKLGRWIDLRCTSFITRPYVVIRVKLCLQLWVSKIIFWKYKEYFLLFLLFCVNN